MRVGARPRSCRLHRRDAPRRALRHQEHRWPAVRNGTRTGHGARPRGESARVLPAVSRSGCRSGSERLTIGHVLTMTMGLEWDEARPYTDPTNSEIAMEAAPDRYRFILERPIMAEPGKRWTLQRRRDRAARPDDRPRYRRSLSRPRTTRCSRPWGSPRSNGREGQDGTPSAASGLRLRPRDLARIGHLILQNGLVQGANHRPVVMARSRVARTRRDR